MKKKKLIKKLQRKIERMETTSSMESRVTALERNSVCRLSYAGSRTKRYTFPEFVVETNNTLRELQKGLQELKSDIKNG